MVPRPLSVLRLAQTGVTLDKEAFNSVLDKVGERPLVIYAISGATRTGKSYLLNYFIKYFESQKQNGQENQNHEADINSEPDQNWVNFELASNFAWRSGKERETTGMNIWSEPYFVQTDDGPVAVLIIDTQGLFDDKTTARQNAIIFSLTTLCSSTTIFNVSRQINEDLLQQIQYFSCYARSIDGNPTTATGGNSPFQNLLLLVRDFEIPDYDHGLHQKAEGSGAGGRNFMRETFHLVGKPENCPEENTIVRKEILENYEDVSCYLLSDPGKKFRDGRSSTPDEDFVEELKSFIEHMVSSPNLVTKKFHGRPSCTGLEFKSFVNSWSELVEKSEETFPETFTLQESIAYMQYSIAKDMAFAWFTQQIETILNQGNGCNLSPDEWEREQITKKVEALNMFNRVKKFKNKEFDAGFQKLLEDAIAEHLEHSIYVPPLQPQPSPQPATPTWGEQVLSLICDATKAVSRFVFRKLSCCKQVVLFGFFLCLFLSRGIFILGLIAMKTSWNITKCFFRRLRSMF